MIERISVTNYKDETLDIDLTTPRGSGFAVTNITGLGPVGADINTVSYASRDGSVFASARVDNRNIVFSFLFLPSDGDSIEDVRQRSYKYFPVKSKVTLVFKTTNRNARIQGYVETNEPDIFSEQESTQISIICPDPYFYDNSSKQKIAFLETCRLFHFPFYNSGRAKEIKMGEVKRMKMKSFTYDGDAISGILLELYFHGEVTGKIVIKNITTNQAITIDTSQLFSGYKLKSGDHIKISTRSGEKYAKLTKYGGNTSDILNCINSCVLDVVGGNNELEISTDTGMEDVIEASITAVKIYEGI